MRILTAASVIGSLMLIGAVPFAAGQSVLAPGSGAPFRLAAGGDSTADQDTYVREAQDKMKEWQHKLHDLRETAEAKGKGAGDAAGSDLNTAWAQCQAASRKLQTAGAEGWESAKADFETASHSLAEAWYKVHPEDK